MKKTKQQQHDASPLLHTCFSMGQQCSTLPALSNIFCTDNETPPTEITCDSFTSKQRRNDANIATMYREDIQDGRAPANLATTPRRTLTETSDSTHESAKLVERDVERRSPCPPIKEGSSASSIDSSHESLPLDVNDRDKTAFETQGCYRLNLGNAVHVHSNAHQILRHASSDSSDCYYNGNRNGNDGDIFRSENNTQNNSNMDIFRSVNAEEPAISPPRILRGGRNSTSSGGQYARNANAEIPIYSNANAMQTLYIYGEYDDVEHLVCDGAKKLHYEQSLHTAKIKEQRQKKKTAERRKQQRRREQQHRNVNVNNRHHNPTQYKPPCSKQQSSIHTNACCTGDTGLLEGYMGVIGSFLCDRAGPNECFQPHQDSNAVE